MSKYVHAQKLNRRVEFQRLTGERDEFGQVLPDTWVRAYEVWAQVTTIASNAFLSQEMITANKETNRITKMVRIRARRVPPTPDMRVMIKGQPHEIRAVLPDDQDDRYVNIGVAVGASNG